MHRVRVRVTAGSRYRAFFQCTGLGLGLGLHRDHGTELFMYRVRVRVRVTAGFLL